MKTRDELKGKIGLRFIFFSSLIIWNSGIITPLIRSDLAIALNPFLKIFYSTICHQDPSKICTINSSDFLVCCRCTGIYFGAFAASLFSIIYIMKMNLNFPLLFFLSIPMLADVVFYSIGFYDYDKLVAISTGVVFGSSIFIFILQTIENSLLTKRS